MRESDFSDTLISYLHSLARFLLGLGGLALIIGLGFLVMYVTKFADGSQIPANELPGIQRNLDLFGNVTLGGALAVALSCAILFWGEEVLGVLMIIGSGALFFAPMLLPSLSGGQTSDLSNQAMSKIQQAGAIAGIISILVFVYDVASRTKLRMTHGAKSDTLKYGKGMKEEREIKNVLMGKCWQLPYCRKFVREKCPIYHARTTCWKERVGCMCEEKVIQNAMEGKVIPKDMVAAAKFIPYNKNLAPEIKAERCRQCVIYNERQRHKYKIALPGILLGCAGGYILFREPLKSIFGGVAHKTDKFISSATLSGKTAIDSADQLGFSIFQEILAAGLVLVLMAYLLKLAEYLFFKIKV